MSKENHIVCEKTSGKAGMLHLEVFLFHGKLRPMKQKTFHKDAPRNILSYNGKDWLICPVACVSEIRKKEFALFC